MGGAHPTPRGHVAQALIRGRRLGLFGREGLFGRLGAGGVALGVGARRGGHRIGPAAGHAPQGADRAVPLLQEADPVRLQDRAGLALQVGQLGVVAGQGLGARRVALPHEGL